VRHPVDLASARPHANGVRIENISRLVGHSATGVTERVYRHQLRAALDEGIAVMDGIFPLDGAGYSLR
jgi:hypothetical protein